MEMDLIMNKENVPTETLKLSLMQMILQMDNKVALEQIYDYLNVLTHEASSYELPEELVEKCVEYHKECLHAGNNYTTEETFNIIRDRLGWK